MKTYDVIIVGAGPAGSAMAILLAQEGYSVLLLEKGTFPRDKVCGDFVSPKGLYYLQKLGCYEEVAQRGFTEIQRVSTYLNGDKLVEGSLPHLPNYLPFAHAIPRNELDEIIFRKAQKAGAITVEKCQVVDIHTTQSIVSVTAQEAGRSRRYAGRVIVGADGANSVVARHAGLVMNDPRYVYLSIRGYCHGLPLQEVIMLIDEDFFPGYGWIFPVRGDLSNVGVGMPKEVVSKHGLSVKDFFKKLEMIIKSLGRENGYTLEISDPKGWPIKTYGGARQNFFDRGILIGEAGSFVDPLSGEGIPLAFESAEMGFKTLKEAFDRGDFSTKTLATYERRWKDQWDSDLKVADYVVSLARNRYLSKLWIHTIRVMGMTAVRDQNYALKIGGIFAGLIPNREGFSPDMIIKSFLHGPAFWAEAFNIRPHNPLFETFSRSMEWVNWQFGIARVLINDFDWFQAWAWEVNQKQRDLFKILATTPRQSN